MKELDFLRKVKSVTFATIEQGQPRARVIDVMLVEDEKIYFTTARGKNFYRQLRQIPHIAIMGMDENSTTVRVNGAVRWLAHHNMDKIFAANPILAEIYPGETKEVLECFCIEKGAGEVFDLSSLPLTRRRFAFGGEQVIKNGYVITNRCIACGTCQPKCPEEAISQGAIYVIDAHKCIECGRCRESCPNDAIDGQASF